MDDVTLHHPRLEELADFLARLNPDKFRYERLVSAHQVLDGETCGTTCCALGWFPALWPDAWKWRSIHQGVHQRVHVDRIGAKPLMCWIDRYQELVTWLGIHPATCEAIFNSLMVDQKSRPIGQATMVELLRWAAREPSPSAVGVLDFLMQRNYQEDGY